MSSDAPWEAYGSPAEAAAASDEPWKAYATPQPAAASAAPTVGYAEDIAKGTAGGLGRGVAGTVGLGGSIGNLTRWGLEKVGVPEGGIDYAKRVLNRAAPMTRVFSGPDAGQVQGAIEGVTGKFYEPQTIPGQYASTIAEFAPGAVMPGGAVGGGIRRAITAKTLNTVVPAVTSETAGQLTKDTPYEPYARFIGGVGGGVAGAKLATPIGPTEGAYARAVAALEKEGVPLTAGQRTGSKNLQYMESNAIDMPLIGGQAARLRDAPLNVLDRAVTERIYPRAELRARGIPDDVNLPDSRVATEGPQILRDAYQTRLAQAPFVSNPQLQNRMTHAQQAYDDLILPSDRAATVANTRNDIVNRLVAGQGQMSGKQYQSIRSQIGDKIRENPGASEQVTALREYKRALDETYLAGLPPADARALMENNRRFALMKQTQRAVDNAGEHLSPQALNNAVKAKRPAGQYAARRGDLDELANAASVVMKPLPNSGTAARLAAQSGGGGTIGTAIGATVGGPVGAAIGFGIGAGAPLIAPGLATSRLGQAYLGNRALPQDIRDVLAQTLMQQGISQPGSVARNKAEREAYRKKQERR